MQIGAVRLLRVNMLHIVQFIPVSQQIIVRQSTFWHTVTS